MTVEELQKELQDNIEAARALQSAAEGDKRHLTPDETELIEKHLGDAEGLESEIDLRTKLDKQETRFDEKMSEPEPRKSEPDPTDNRANVDVDEAEIRRVPAQAADKRHKGKHGFRSFGEYAQACVKAGSRTNRSLDPRLETRTASSTFGNELSGADGGFAVPPDFVNNINSLIFDEEGILGRTDQMSATSNSMTIPIDDDSPWSTSGIVAAWEGEGDAYAQKKPLLKQNEVRLNKLGVVVPMTEEILEDASALNSYVPKKAASKINFKIDLSILQGTGAGQPQGILTAPSIISIAKEGSQVADTVVYANIRKMWARLYAPSRPNSVWIMNQDVEPQLQLMEFTGTGTFVDTTPVYIPNNSVAGAPFTTLYGRPVIFHQGCETLGDLGDIFLADLSQYLTITKGGGIRADTSMHMWFDQDLVAFKFRIRIGGLPWWPTTLSSRDGTTTYSPFITLAERT